MVLFFNLQLDNFMFKLILDTEHTKIKQKLLSNGNLKYVIEISGERKSELFTVADNGLHKMMSDRMLDAYLQSDLTGIDRDNYIPVDFLMTSHIDSYPFTIKPKINEFFSINIIGRSRKDDIFISKSGETVISTRFMKFLKQFVLGEYLIAPFKSLEDEDGLIFTKDPLELKNAYLNDEYFRFHCLSYISILEESNKLKKVILLYYPPFMSIEYLGSRYFVTKLFYEKFISTDLIGALSFSLIERHIVCMDEDYVDEIFEIPNLFEIKFANTKDNNDIFIINNKLIVNNKFINFINSLHYCDEAESLLLYHFRIQACVF
jgi:hypothetical protein